MYTTLEDGLRALHEAADAAKSIQVELDEEYLAAIAQIEAHPDNRPGTDKSHVWRAAAAFQNFVTSARRLF